MRQPDDPGPEPHDPDPFAGLKSQTWVRVYLLLVFLAAIVWAAWLGYDPTVHE